jgi:hypothetical protein
MALAGVSQPCIVQRKAFDDVLLQRVVRPLAETHRHRAAHPESQRQHHVQVVMFDLARHFAPAFGLNCSE